MMDKEYFTVKEAAKYLNVKPKTLYSWMSKRVLPYYQFEGTKRLKKKEMDSWAKIRYRKPINPINQKVRDIEDEWSL